MNMNFPNTLNFNTLKCYEIKEGFHCTESKIRCQNFGEWCEKIPKPLKELCIKSISENWAEHPKLEEITLPEDRCMLLSLLPTDLPLELTVPKIKDNIYWKKCSLARWPSRIPRHVIEKDMFIFPASLAIKDENPNEVENQGDDSVQSEDSLSRENEYKTLKTWKQYYLENHIAEFLEKLEPDDYDPEEVIRR